MYNYRILLFAIFVNALKIVLKNGISLSLTKIFKKGVVMKFKRLIKASLFVCIGLLQAEGFIAGTLVYSEQEIAPIEQIIKGNYVIAYGVRELPAYPVIHIVQSSIDNYIKIKISDHYVCVAPDQKFYSLNKYQWINACELTSLDRLLCYNGTVVLVDAVDVVYEQQVMYALTVETSHLFCVSPYGIIVHNIEPVTTGGALAVIGTLSITCPPAAAVAAVGELIAFGVVSLGVYWAYKKSQKNKLYDNQSIQNIAGSCRGGGKDPNHEDEDDKEKCPHGTYEDAEYHHSNSHGKKSPCPQNGQECLDNSLKIDGSLKQRIGIEGDKFVVFKETVPGKFHGYIMTWKEIVSGGNSHTEAIRKTLLKSGLVSKSGKIIKTLVK